MGRVWACLAVVGMLATGTFARGADKAELTQRLHNAAVSSSIDDPALKPWHLKLTYQLVDKKGATTEEGTIEEWWSASGDKRTYSSPTYTSTEIRRGEEVYRTSGQPSPPYLLDVIRDEVVHPFPNETEVNDSVPDLRVESFGAVKLDCIMLTHPVKNIPHPPLGMFPTYCLDQDKNRLRDSLRYGSENVARNAIGSFQGRGVPVDLAVSMESELVAKGHIATLTTSAEEEHFFDPSSSLEAQDQKTIHVGDGPDVPMGVIAGSKLSGRTPVYPVEDKNSRTSGTVHLHIVIGTDGHVHQISVIDTPSQTLAASALAAVRSWVYKPYLLNGRPCSVDVTVRVSYNFGGG